MRSDVDSLPGSRLWYRAIVAYLHFIQPLARLRGRIRGVLSPPEVALPRAEPQTSRGPRPSLAEAWRALLLISGSVTEDRFWSETWTSADRVLAQLTDWLRRSRAVRTIEIDEGWSDDRDVSVFVGRWAWLDVRALVEEHGGGKALLRVSTHLRPTTFGVVDARSASGARCSSAPASGVALRWPLGRRRSPAALDAACVIVARPAGARRRRPRSCGAASQRVDGRTGHDRDAVGPGARAAHRAVAAARRTGCAARSSSSS